VIASALYGQGGSRNVVISQVYGGGGNAAAILRNDYIELFNRGRDPVSLTGWTVSYGSATGDLSQSTVLSGTIQPGRYYLVQQAAGTGGSADLPLPDAIGVIPMSATAGKVALSALVSGGMSVVDLVGYGGANQFEGGGSAGTLSNTTAAVRRRGGCQDTNDNSADFQIATPAPRNSQAETLNCEAPEPEPLRLSISEVQGPGAESPFVGRRVRVRGVVTAGRNNGFWIESEFSDRDNDPLTSEGLFVFTSFNPPNVASPRNIVEVTGTVAEFRPAADPESPPLTELIDVTATVVGATQAVSLPVALPASGDWERFEGMTVMSFGTVVGPTLGSINESTGTAASSGVFYLVTADGARPFRDSAGIPGTGLLRVDSRARGAALDVAVGDYTGVQGPLDYAFRTDSVVAQPTLAFQTGASVAVPPPAPLVSEFSVVSMNLQRLFDDKDDPGTGDPLVQPAALQRRIARIAQVIKEKLWSPDVIGVEEVENIDVLRALATAAGEYDAHLFEGNDPGGIDVGLLVKRGRVQVLSVAQEGKTVTHGDNLLTNDRPPLVARLMISATPLTVIVNHLRSLIDAGTVTVDRKRRAQAEYLRDLITRLYAAGNQNIISIGDYNMFQFDPLMTTIRSAAGSPRNLTDTLPFADSYSYIQDGVAQTLDHMLVSDTLFPRLSRYQVVRLNAEYPAVYRNDINRLERYSDHDVPVAYFNIAGESRLSAAGVRNAATMLSGSVAPNEIVTIFGRGFGPSTGVGLTGLPAPVMLGGTRVLFDGIEAGLIYVRSDQVTVIVPPNLKDKPQAEIRIEYLRTAPSTVIVPMASSSPGIFTMPMTGAGQGAILNQDYSVNGAANPAARGSIVMIYATGAREETQPKVLIGGKIATVSYSGQAPGLVAGVVQINARVPFDAPPAGNVPVIVSLGGRPSGPGVTMAVQ
jgi:uncharacterized protein